MPRAAGTWGGAEEGINLRELRTLARALKESSRQMREMLALVRIRNLAEAASANDGAGRLPGLTFLARKLEDLDSPTALRRGGLPLPRQG